MSSRDIDQHQLHGIPPVLLRRRERSLVIPGRTWLVPLLLVACKKDSREDQRPPAAPGFTWGVPEGWRTETIPFPLEFAPDIPHRGVEELRFAPGFFQSSAPGWWTYAFAWVVSDAGALDMSTLAAELTTYFRGLTATVAHSKKDLPALDLARIRARIGADGHGSVLTYDAFGDGREIQLDVTVAVQPCGAGKAVLFTAAPRGRPPLAPSPREVLDSFRCR